MPPPPTATDSWPLVAHAGSLRKGPEPEKSATSALHRRGSNLGVVKLAIDARGAFAARSRLSRTVGELGEVLRGSKIDNNPLSPWYKPFCHGCSPAFLEQLELALEVDQLSPGDRFFREPATEDFLLTLTRGSVDVRGAPKASVTKVSAPLLICGYDKNALVEVVAKTECEVYRLSIEACSKMAATSPEDTWRVLLRFMTFQHRVETQLGISWWSPAAALSRLAPFAASGRDFVDRVAKILTLEVYLPGEVIVEQGALVDSTLILESGRCTIEKNSPDTLFVSDAAQEEVDGYWIGGIGGVCGFTGDLKRKATVRARTVCKVHKVPNMELVEILAGIPTERQSFRAVAEKELRSKSMERLEDHAFFSNFSRNFLKLLRPRCRVQVFFANEPLMRQGELADSLFILGSESCVVLEVDNLRTKEMHGRHCLGIVALINPKPTRRASTVITLAACAVRVLTREDWLDALKLHPEHREWIDAFTQEQMEKICEARECMLRQRAWEKIQVRDSAAKKKYMDRRHKTEFSPRAPESTAANNAASFRRSAVLSNVSIRSAGTQNQSTLKQGRGGDSNHLSETREAWPCFNGASALVPHTQLPPLAKPPALKSSAEDEPVATTCSERSAVQRLLGEQEGNNSMPSWDLCDAALGVPPAPPDSTAL